MTPKKKARKAVEAEIREVIQRGGAMTAKQIVEKINAKVAGWVTYFRMGKSNHAFNEVRDYLKMKVRTLLTRRTRRCKRSIGWRRWSNEYCRPTINLASATIKMANSLKGRFRAFWLDLTL
jgi:hypothetical protein